MGRLPLFLLTSLAMLAFAANSLLCRAALRDSDIDPATFTAVRLASGALALWVLVRLQGGGARAGGNWTSSLALFVYATAFSFAYIGLSAGIGALLLFAAVQATMVGYGLWLGDTMRPTQLGGLAAAFTGMVLLLLPESGIVAPPLGSAALMLLAGMAWGVYSLRGRGALDPTAATQGNFLRTVPLVAALLALSFPWLRGDISGFGFAVASGALASGGGYAVWYAVTRHLRPAQAATVQLSVPLIATIAGVLLLGETMSMRQVLASAAILGGILVFMLVKVRPAARPS